MAKGSMRDQMPTVAAFVDSLRAAFGKSGIDDVIKRGLRPDCEPEHRVFFSEGGATLGVAYVPDPSAVVRVGDMQLGPVFHLEKKGRG